MKTANRVAVNSLALYFNMCVTMVATLLGTRFVLEALGREEFGLYALIGSIVAMLSFLNVAMAAATQRFLSFAIGANDRDRVDEIFYYSVVIHLLISAILSVLLLIGGDYMIYNVLDIAPALRGVAVVVLWCMVAGVMCTINAVPYEAAMNAHEDIAQIANINIVEALLKLAAAIGVLFLDSDKLVCYALFILCAQLVAFAGKCLFSRSHYAETHFRFHRISDVQLVKKMVVFAIWNLIGAGCSIARYQGAAVLLNAFFGLAINAAYGVAQQINGFILFFANSIVRPLRPLIVKAEGAGEHERMHQLSFTTCRITFLMMSLAIIPLYQNMPYVLSIWLESTPEGALEFCRAFLIIALINQLCIGVSIAVESVGNIKRMQVIVGGMHLLPLPLGYALFCLGGSAYTIMYCIIAEEILATVMRLWVAKKDADLPMFPFVKETLLPCVLTFLLSYYIAEWVFSDMTASFRKLLTSGIFSVFLLAVFGYLFCLSTMEKRKLTEFVKILREKVIK